MTQYEDLSQYPEIPSTHSSAYPDITDHPSNSEYITEHPHHTNYETIIPEELPYVDDYEHVIEKPVRHHSKHNRKKHKKVHHVESIQDIKNWQEDPGPYYEDDEDYYEPAVIEDEYYQPPKKHHRKNHRKLRDLYSQINQLPLKEYHSYEYHALQNLLDRKPRPSHIDH